MSGWTGPGGSVRARVPSCSTSPSTDRDIFAAWRRCSPAWTITAVPGSGPRTSGKVGPKASLIQGVSSVAGSVAAVISSGFFFLAVLTIVY